MNRVRTAVISSIACAAVLAALPGGVLAAKHKPAKQKPAQTTTGTTGTKTTNGKNVLYGTLQSISSTSATVSGAAAGTMTLGANTRFVAHSYAAAAAGIKVNQQVAILGRNGTAAVVEYDTKAFAVGATVIQGTLSLSGTTLTVTPAGGTAVTVTTNSQTRYVVNGATTTTAPSLPANTSGRVQVVRYTDGTSVARVVAVGAAAPSTRARTVVLWGTVAAASAGETSLTVTTPSGSVTVGVTSSTKFRVNGQAVAAAPAFAANQQVQVIARQNADGSYTALLVSTRS